MVNANCGREWVISQSRDYTRPGRPIYHRALSKTHQHRRVLHSGWSNMLHLGKMNENGPENGCYLIDDHIYPIMTIPRRVKAVTSVNQLFTILAALSTVDSFGSIDRICLQQQESSCLSLNSITHIVSN